MALSCRRRVGRDRGRNRGWGFLCDECSVRVEGIERQHGFDFYYGEALRGNRKGRVDVLPPESIGTEIFTANSSRPMPRHW